jgi:hypothetical protein
VRGYLASPDGPESSFAFFGHINPMAMNIPLGTGPAASERRGSRWNSPSTAWLSNYTRQK